MRIETLSRDEAGRAVTHRCAGCAEIWVVDRSEDVDNEEMMIELMAKHDCFPGITVDDVERVREAAAMLAVAFDDPSMGGRRADDPAVTPEAVVLYDKQLTAATFELALQFDCNVALLQTASPHSADYEGWAMICAGAAAVARRAAATDEARADNLLRLVAHGIPADRFAFAPRHVRLALERLPAYFDGLDLSAEPYLQPRDAVRAWLEHFEGRAEALA